MMPGEEIKVRPWVPGGKHLLFMAKIMGVAVLTSGAFSDKGEGMPSVDMARRQQAGPRWHCPGCAQQ